MNDDVQTVWMPTYEVTDEVAEKRSRLIQSRMTLILGLDPGLRLSAAGA